MTPGSFVSKSGTLIGGTGKEAGDAFRSYITGVRGTLSDSWSPLWQHILNVNGYVNKIARLEFPAAASNREDVDQRWGMTAPQIKLFGPNEVRSWARLPPKDDKELTEIAEFWTKLAPIPGTQGLPGQGLPGGPGAFTIPSSIANLGGPIPTAMHGLRGATINQLIDETRGIMKRNQREILEKGVDKILDKELIKAKSHNLRTISGAKKVLNHLHGGCSCGHH
jgi:hypothetical protein